LTVISVFPWYRPGKIIQSLVAHRFTLKGYVMSRIKHLAIAALVLTGIGAPAAAAPALERVIMRLNFVPGVEHSFLYLGKEKGWYAEAGIDLEVLPGQGSTVAVKNVGNGEEQFAIADTASVARGWEVGVPLVYTAMLLKDTPAAIYSLKSKGIESIGDLCGKRVGVNIKSTTAEQYRAMLRLANLKNCKIDEVPIGSGGTKEVLSGAVDAAVNFVYTDALQVKTSSGHVNTILAKDYFKLFGLGIITNKKLIEKNPELVDRFMKVTMKSLRYALGRKDEAMATFLKISPSANVAYEGAKFDMFRQLLLTDDPTGNSVGKQTKPGWDATLKTLYDLGIVKSVLDSEGRFIPLKN
jgi:NitT/TauT family transport system substrate-binding protein